MEIPNPTEEKTEEKPIEQTEKPAEKPPEEPGEKQPWKIGKKVLSLGPVERLMTALACVAAVALVLAIAVSLPYMHRRAVDDDPEIYRDYGEEISLPTPEETVIQEPTPEETAPGSRNATLDRNPYSRFDFQFTRHNYLKLQNVPSSVGVDVSQYQGEIDWNKVRASGVEFAIIRLGLRGYGQEGRMREDTCARQNLAGAKAAGLKIGVYFFSQALSIQEVDEEIQFILDILSDTGTEPDMPVVLDWEIPAADNPRTKNMDGRTLTDIQLHFCGQMKKMGYQPMVYFNWHQSENLYYLADLEDYPFWLALYQEQMTYPWRVEMWQWTHTGRVPGISGDVDINVYMPY